MYLPILIFLQVTQPLEEKDRAYLILRNIPNETISIRRLTYIRSQILCLLAMRFCAHNTK
jgi:hypothetical protein